MKDLDSIYFAARELPPEDRPAYLTRVCGDDQALRARVEQMLAVADQADAFITDLPDDPKPAGAPLRTIALDLPESSDEVVGQKIGRYKILEKVGEGGCGVVYVAEQTEPVRRRVALKVIKLGMDTRQVVARFEAERQALAMMDHPNIAKVLDAGSTETGRPYFVMELVRGIKITEYCDQASLSTKDRLGLFIQVCHAIQHAHQKGIIHRDIKPSNILVTINDGVPVPKVIDFGIAKATEGRLTDATVYTQLHQFIGTPAYMSPEQAEMTSLDIDTRSDIYSLGVLLYELLAGKTPFDAQELMSLGIDAMRKTIREKEPVRPSTRLATLQGDELTTAAKRRAIEAPRLIHLLKGDLDWIVMKCLEKDRTRRYDTATGLAADLKRHLDNEPVLACPPSKLYEFQKTIRRNKVGFAAAGAIFLILVAAVLVSAWQAVRARQAEQLAKERLVEVGKERDAKEVASQDAEAVSKFLTEVFQSPDPARNGRTITVAETLDNAAKKLESDPAVPSTRRARLEATLATTYFGLGLFSNTLALSEKVRDYDVATFGLENSNTIQATRRLATSYSVLGRTAEALNLYEKVLPLDRKVLGPENDETLSTMAGLASCYAVLGRADEALKLREEVLTLCRKALGPENELTLKAMALLANSYLDAGLKDKSLKLREETLALDRKALGTEHPETLETMSDLAGYYHRIGRTDEALKLQEEALAISRKLFGPDHDLTLTAMEALAGSCFDLGRKDEALKLREELLTLDRKVLGPEHPDTIWAMNNLGSSYSGVGLKDQAVKLSEDALAIALKRDSNSVESAEAYAQLGLRLDEAGRGDEAIKSLEQAVRLEPNNKDNQYWLGKALVDHQRYAEALPAIHAAQKLLDPNDGRRWETDQRLILVETMLGGADRFLPALRQTVADNPTNTLKSMQLAITSLWLGQTNEHQAICRKLLNFAANSPDPSAHDRAAKACLIQPNPDPEMLKLAVASGRQALALSATNDSARRWFLITAGLANVRDGKPAQAEPLLTEALEHPDNSNQHGIGLAYRAIAYARLGRTNEARADFSTLEKLALPLPAHDSISPDLLDADHLAVCFAYEEAKALLNPPSMPHP